MKHTHFLNYTIIGMLFLNMISGNCAIPSSCECAVQEVAQHYFNIHPNNLEVTVLAGGHSNISLLLSLYGNKYVLRIKNKNTPLLDLKRETFAMQQAAQQHIAPRLLYVSENYDAMLMEYIPASTLSLYQSKQPENIIKIAQLLKKVHRMPLNPYSSDTDTQSAVEVYQSICHNLVIRDDLDAALGLMRKYDAELAPYRQFISSHGELNPRNILVHEDQIYFIDWEYAGRDDSFMDLSYLALRLDYTVQEEFLFLDSYLQHTHSEEELAHYYRAKKLNYAQLVIYFFYFSLREQEIEKTEWDRKSPLKPYEYYIKVFVDKEDQDISLSQFYYDMARICLVKATE